MPDSDDGERLLCGDDSEPTADFNVNLAGGLKIANGAAEAAIGGLLVYFGVTHGGAVCSFPLAYWAVVFGAVSISFGGLGIADGIITLCLLDYMWWSFIANILTSQISFGLLVWGSVVAFSEDRWTKIIVSPPKGPSECAVEFYEPVAIAIIITWVLIGKAWSGLVVSCFPTHAAPIVHLTCCAGLRPFMLLFTMYVASGASRFILLEQMWTIARGATRKSK